MIEESVNTEYKESMYKLTVLQNGLSETDSFIIDEFELYDLQKAIDHRAFFEMETEQGLLYLNTEHLVSIKIENIENEE